MHRALKIVGYTVGGLTLAGLATVGVARLVRYYHSFGSAFPFPTYSSGTQITNLPEATSADRDPSIKEWALIQLAEADGWPVKGDMKFYTQAGQACLKFTIDNQVVHLGIGPSAANIMIVRCPNAEDLQGTTVTYTEFLERIKRDASES